MVNKSMLLSFICNALWLTCPCCKQARLPPVGAVHVMGSALKGSFWWARESGGFIFRLILHSGPAGWMLGRFHTYTWGSCSHHLTSPDGWTSCFKYSLVTFTQINVDIYTVVNRWNGGENIFTSPNYFYSLNLTCVREDDSREPIKQIQFS